MYIVLDQSICKKYQKSCEKCFGDHIRKEDFNTAECIVSIDGQDRAALVFRIFDRNKRIKNLVVNGENLELALNSWIALWEQQAGLVI
jgi:hypothetical protein